MNVKSVVVSAAVTLGVIIVALAALEIMRRRMGWDPVGELAKLFAPETPIASAPVSPV